jgi:hypothetical protein
VEQLHMLLLHMLLLHMLLLHMLLSICYAIEPAQ